MNLQVVTKQQAISLKEEGFNWPTHYYYNDLSDELQGGYGLVSLQDQEYYAPENQLVFKWYRDKYSGWITIKPSYEGVVWSIGNDLQGFASSYEEAESQVVDGIIWILTYRG